MIDAAQLQQLQLLLSIVLALQALLFAPLIWFASFMWRLERRTFRIELHLGLEKS